jgi:hypothetical protein
MKFTETIGDLRRRQITGNIHKPLRSFAELCDELGVPPRKVSGQLRRKDAPKPKTKHRSNSGGQQSWYDPEEFKSWWRSLEGNA